jgi:hypothetical protein
VQKEKPPEAAPIQIQLRPVNNTNDASIENEPEGPQAGDDGMMKKAVGRRAPPKLHKYGTESI